MTTQETVVWSQAQLYAWLYAHVGDGHRLRLQVLDEAEAGSFVCDCGADISARPIVPTDPTSGLYAVTGAQPVTSVPGPPPSLGLTLEQIERERQADGTFRVHCLTCHKSVSSPLREPVIVRAWVTCPECIEADTRSAKRKKR